MVPETLRTASAYAPRVRAAFASDGTRSIRAPVALAVYSFVAIANVNMAAFFALAPTFRDDLGLSGTRRDLLFTGTGLAMLLLALPMGGWADRFGARLVTVATTALLLASAVAHALANDFWSLLGARLLFAAAFTGMLTAAMAWLAVATPPERQARAIGGIMPFAGLGLLTGPYLSGALTDASGTRLAYGVLSVLSLAPLLLALLAPAARTETTTRTPIRESLRALRFPLVAAAVVLNTLGIVTDVSLNLLVPQQLDDNGLGAGTRGAVLSIGAGVFVVTALLSVRSAHRLTNLRVAGLSSITVALAVVPALLSDATSAQVATMIVRGLVLSVLFVVAYPLGTLGANAEGVPLGAATGLIMLATGAASTGTPLAAGRIADAIGSTTFYALLAALAVAAGSWMLRLERSTVADVSPGAATRRTTR